MDRRFLYGDFVHLKERCRQCWHRLLEPTLCERLVVPSFRVILTGPPFSRWRADCHSLLFGCGASHLQAERCLPLWRRRGVRKALGLHSVTGVNLRRQTFPLGLTASVSLRRKEQEDAAL